MRHSKRLTIKKDENAERAIQAHLGFITYVAGKVSKIGIENVLSVDEHKWLRKPYERVLDFAQEVQLKRIATKIEGTGENGEFKLVIEIVNENNTSQEPRNRISEYVTL